MMNLFIIKLEFQNHSRQTAFPLRTRNQHNIIASKTTFPIGTNHIILPSFHPKHLDYTISPCQYLLIP